MKYQRTIALGKEQPPAVLRLKARAEKTYGLGIWLVVLLAIIGLCLVNHQNNLTPTPAQETAFHKEQARRLAALGLGPVTTEGGVAYAEK